MQAEIFQALALNQARMSRVTISVSYTCHIHKIIKMCCDDVVLFNSMHVKVKGWVSLAPIIWQG
jgi:hypothetical protein